MYIASNDTAITPVAVSEKTIGSVGSTPKRSLSKKAGSSHSRRDPNHHPDSGQGQSPSEHHPLEDMRAQ